jgi:hypothetical protein
MARTLPENTVDAWTAVSLVAQGVSWLWLPTTRQGAATGGSHPGDQSALLSGRLVLIENKGIEESDTIDIGGNSNQKPMLLKLQKFGRLLMAKNPTWRGWVFYGIPTQAGPNASRSWTGRDFKLFPSAHRLVCPCQVPASRRSKIHGLGFKDICNCVSTAALPPIPQCCVCSSCVGSGGALTLDRLADFAHHGQVGLPMNRAVLANLAVCASNPENLNRFLDNAQGEFPEPTQETDNPLDVLTLISDLSAASTDQGVVAAIL